MDNLNKTCDLFLDKLLDKRKMEYLNDFGYNFKINKKEISHYESYTKSLPNIQKRKPKL